MSLEFGAFSVNTIVALNTLSENKKVLEPQVHPFTVLHTCQCDHVDQIFGFDNSEIFERASFSTKHIGKVQVSVSHSLVQ